MMTRISCLICSILGLLSLTIVIASPIKRNGVSFMAKPADFGDVDAKLNKLKLRGGANLGPLNQELMMKIDAAMGFAYGLQNIFLLKKVASRYYKPVPTFDAKTKQVILSPFVPPPTTIAFAQIFGIFCLWINTLSVLVLTQYTSLLPVWGKMTSVLWLATALFFNYIYYIEGNSSKMKQSAITEVTFTCGGIALLEFFLFHMK